MNWSKDSGFPELLTQTIRLFTLRRNLPGTLRDSRSETGRAAFQGRGIGMFRCLPLASALLILSLSSLTGCGGSSRKAITVAIGTPSSTSVDQGESVSLTATVANDSTNAGVTWSISCSQGECGTLSSNTTTSVTYNAPAMVSSGFTVTITATSNAKAGVTATLTLTVVVPPTIGTASGALAGGTVGSTYSVTLTASGGVTPYKWSVTTGSLPAGLSLSSSAGTITGIPTASGSSDFTVTLTDSGSPALTASLEFSITIAAAPAISFATTTLPAGSVGVAYAQTVTATGGAGALTYKVTSGALPAGLTMSSAGAISGAPTAAATGTAKFTVTASDAYGDTGSQSLSITIAAAPAITFTTASLPAGVAGVAYAQSVSATGGAGTLTYAVASGTSLPAGLTMSTAGAISGTPTTAGTSTFTVTASDAYGDSQSESLTILVNATALKVSTTSLPQGVVGTAYSQTLSATGGSGAGYTWTKSSGSLPAGLSLTSAGTISGTPTATGTATFSVQVTDSDSDTATASLTITVNAALSVTTTTLPAGTVNVSYSQTLAATGGVSPYTWSVSAGSLPAGLTLTASTGAISGTPTTVSTAVSFTVKVTDADSNAATQSLSITVSAGLAVSTTSLGAGTVNVSYSQTLTATGGVSPYTWSISSGSLPAGLTLTASTGVISGTPTTAGSSSFTVKVTDADSNTATQSLSISIYAALTVTTASLPTGAVNFSYSQTLAAAGGVSPYTWSISAGSLPAGLTLAANTGVISGTPTAAGSAVSFTVKVTDSASNTATKSLSITINPALSVTTASLPAGTENTSYSQMLAATGGQSPYTWSISAGSLPAGLTLAGSTGVISGTPTTSGAAVDFTVEVTDADSDTATQNLSITINPGALVVTTTSLAEGTVDSAYSQTLAATGGASPYTWNIISGSLPAGLTLTGSTGVVAGTPTTPGTSSFEVQVEDSASHTATGNVTLKILPTTLAVSTSSLPNGILGESYDSTLVATGGVTPYTWSILSGSLPAGLTLNSSSGVISGTPTATGTSSVTVEVTDADSDTATQSLSIKVTTAPLTVDSEGTWTGTEGVAFSLTLVASGGTAPYTWSVSSGSLPTGLTLNAGTGVISGTPTTPGRSTFEVQVQDSASNTVDSGSLSIRIYSGLEITTRSLPYGSTGVAYEMDLSAASGTSPYTWAVTSGSLPAGLSLSSAGVITGTPTCSCTTPTTSLFQVTVTDSESTPATVSANFSITINNENLPRIESTTINSGSVGSAYSFEMQEVGGATPLAWSILSGTLPPGLTLASNGTIGGTPTTVGTSTFVVQLEDGDSNTASRPESIQIYPSALQVDNTSLQFANVGQRYSTELDASGGSGEYLSWNITSGSLPSGLALTSSDGVIAGSPSVAGSSTFTIEVKDSDSNTASATLTLTVYDNPACPSGNESELNGTYAMLVSGFSGDGLGIPVATLASFTANGAGGVTGGELDTNSGASTTGSANVAIGSGSYYSVGASGAGCITINTANGTNTYAFVLGGVSSGVATRGRIMEFDDDSGYGQLQTGALALQTSADFALNQLAPNFAFGISGDDSSVGRFAFGGSLTNSTSGSFGNVYADSNDNGTVNSAMSGGNGGFSGAPDANGRTSASISIGGDTYGYIAYIVNQDEVFLLSSDPITLNPVASGTMLGTASSFTGTSVSGNYLFAASGADASNRGYSFAVFGIVNFTAGDWNGTVNQYELDGPGYAQGAPTTSSGTYTVDAASGRVTLTSGSGTQPAIYLTNSSSGPAAFVIDLDSGAGAPAYEGTLLVQPSKTYSNSSVSGNFEASMATMSSGEDETFVGSASGGDGEAMFTLDAAIIGSAQIGGLTEEAPYTINSDGTGTSGYGTKTLLLTNGTTVYLMDIGGGPAEIIEFDQQ